jgi:hypothetical protein
VARGITTSSCSSTDLGTKTTMTNYVDAEHIAEFVHSGSLEVLDVSVSRQLEVWLQQNLPLRDWSTIVDWDRVSSTMLQWNQVSDEDAVTWATTTSIRRSPYGVLLFDPDQPCVVGQLDFMIRNLDSLVWKAPGCRILFGAQKNDVGEWEFANGVIEFNGKGELFATTDA